MINNAIQNFIHSPDKLSNDKFVIMRLVNKYETFKNKFDIFKTLEEGEKIGKDESGNYWVYKSGYFQKVWRLWYSEDRHLTIVQLNADFKSFFAFLDIFEEEYILNINKKSFKNLKKEICELLDDIIPGLYNLKNTYEGFRAMGLKIDSIILTILDFKDKIHKIKNNNNNVNLIYEKNFSISI